MGGRSPNTELRAPTTAPLPIFTPSATSTSAETQTSSSMTNCRRLDVKGSAPVIVRGCAQITLLRNNNVAANDNLTKAVYDYIVTNPYVVSHRDFPRICKSRARADQYTFSNSRAK